jgi:hypothetical protein
LSKNSGSFILSFVPDLLPRPHYGSTSSSVLSIRRLNLPLCLQPQQHVLAIRSDPYPPHLDLNSLLSLPFFFNLAEYGLFFEFHGRIELSDSLFDLVFQNEATLADGRSYLFVVFRQGSFGKGNPAVEFE